MNKISNKWFATLGDAGFLLETYRNMKGRTFGVLKSTFDAYPQNEDKNKFRNLQKFAEINLETDSGELDYLLNLYQRELISSGNRI